MNFSERIYVSSQKKELNESEKRFVTYVNSFSQVVVLSPHFDDAILSMGSFLLFLNGIGKKSRVINFFTQEGSVSTPYTQRLIHMGGCSNPHEYYEKRKQEDLRVYKKLKNISVSGADLVDAAWRVDSEGKAYYEDSSLGAICENDKTEDLAYGKLNELEISSDALVFAPLARGKHVDHQIVRNIAAKAFVNVVYYSDIPYSAHFGEEEEFIVEHDLVPLSWKGDQAGKKDLVLEYESQLTSLLRRGDMHLDQDRFYIQRKNFK